MLRAADLPQLNFIGFVEGDGIGKGAADVIVTEGFSGNIALKAAEGTARQIAEYLRGAMARTWRSKIGYLFAKNAFKAVRDKVDPNKSNGAVFLGLRGIVVKSHGSADRLAFATALARAYNEASHGLLERIGEEVSRMNASLGSAA